MKKSSAALVATALVALSVALSGCAELEYAFGPKERTPEPRTEQQVAFTRAMSTVLNSFPEARIKGNEREVLECGTDADGEQLYRVTQTLSFYHEDVSAGVLAAIGSLREQGFDVRGQADDDGNATGLVAGSPLGNELVVSTEDAAILVEGTGPCLPRDEA